MKLFKKKKEYLNKDGTRKNIASENKLRRFNALAEKERRRYLYLKNEVSR